MNKLIRMLCIFSLICISVYTSVFKYNDLLINNLIVFITLVYSFFIGTVSNCGKKNMIRYIIIYIFWNMNYLVFIKHINTTDSFISTLLLNNIYLDILAVLAVGNILLFITKKNKYLKLIFAIISMIGFMLLKNYIFTYISIFLIGNILKFKNVSKNTNNFINTFASLHLSIYIIHKIFIYLLVENKIITASITDLIGTIVLIYILGFCFCYYIKMFRITNYLL